MADMAAVKYDIDYRVTFPSNNHSDEIGRGSCINEKTEPVIILLGWAGCTDRYIAKYSSIYGNRCITISYTAPNHDIFFRPHNHCNAAEKLLEVIVDLDLKAHPIFVHSFSNGGGMVYRWISQLIHSKTEFKQIRLTGAIFDSCPGKRRMAQGVKALMAASKYHGVIKYFLAFLLACYLFYEYVELKIKMILHLTVRESTFSYWQGLENDKATCPQLYLYSRADDIISHIDVEDMTAIRMQRGVDVKTVCWEDSGHVAHLVKHRESYIKTCLDFIDYCVERKI